MWIVVGAEGEHTNIVEVNPGPATGSAPLRALLRRRRAQTNGKDESSLTTMRLEEAPATTSTYGKTSPPTYGRRKHPEEALQVLGWKTTVLVDGQQSGGCFALVECEGARGYALPLHVHHREDELLYVLEGRLTVLLGEEEFLVPAGVALTLPRGVEHSFVVESEEARVLVLVSPAGFEGFLAELGQPEGTLPVGEDEYALERLICVAARYGVDLIGPGFTGGAFARRFARTQKTHKGE